jgi:hypothetical protein
MAIACRSMSATAVWARLASNQVDDILGAVIVVMMAVWLAAVFAITKSAFRRIDSAFLC